MTTNYKVYVNGKDSGYRVSYSNELYISSLIQDLKDKDITGQISLVEEKIS